MSKISSRGREVALKIQAREPFETYGALRAESYGYLNVATGHTVKCGPFHAGRLAGDDLAAFRRDASEIVYAVFSYVTPIAWVTASGTVHRVAQKFSVTTSKHQGKLYLLGD